MNMRICSYRVLTVLGLALHCCGAPAIAADRSPEALEESRQRMITQDLMGGGITNTRVLQAMRATPRHEFAPTKPIRQGLSRYVAAAGRASDPHAADAGGLYDRATRSAAQRHRARDRHRQRLPGRGAQPVGQGSLFDRDRRKARQARRANAEKAELRQYLHENWRRFPRLARKSPLRQDHLHLLTRKSTAADH